MTSEPAWAVGLRRATWIWVALVLVLVAVLTVGQRIHPRYVIYRPGGIFDTLGQSSSGSPLIAVTGATTYPTQGSLSFTTVAYRGSPGAEITLWEYLRAKVDANAELVPYEQVYPENATADQVKQAATAQMNGSQQEAVAIALRATGRVVPEKVVVGAVVPQGPADGKLIVGDRVTQVGDTAVTSATSVRDLVQKATANRALTIGVVRSGKAVTVAVTPVSSGGRLYLGISLATEFTYPVDVTISAGDVGGPSAGLMFSLGVYDKLTPGALTGGKAIAGTGTIDDSGAVGAIGGITLKMIGAADGGAQWFLAPKADCSEVVGHVPDGLRVVSVSTFTEAKAALDAIAAGTADALPGCG